ncbi:MAG: chemotaxis protein CheW, partial [Candidatus Tectomicrobia bacterium]|nr:chemotaxis protein CheW [Candidatus Tectomicrobia bacterium]
ETPAFEDVPQTPLHCQQVLLWEGETLPVIDLTAWLTGQPAERAHASVGIVGWQERLGTIPQYGALLFTGMPQKVQVRDEQVCDLPEQPSAWKAVAISCFQHDGQPVPILDVLHIFSDALVGRR